MQNFRGGHSPLQIGMPRPASWRPHGNVITGVVVVVTVVVVTVVVVVVIVIVVVVVGTVNAVQMQSPNRGIGRHVSPDGQMPLQAGADAPHCGGGGGGTHPQLS